MNRYQNGTWSFRAAVSDAPKQWEVQYICRVANRPARRMFVTEGDAKRFADVTGGKVRRLEPRGGYR